MTMRQLIRKARTLLRTMPQPDKIDIMVTAGVMTPTQADEAKEKLRENDTLPRHEDAQ